MATIRSTVQLIDNVSPVARGISSAMSMCVGSFEALQKVASNSADTRNLQDAKDCIRDMNTAVKMLESDIGNANMQQQNFN
ncbi:MAG: hypothetical protein ACI4SM_02400, partial [Candidatus Gastranaerophilaceae bacterium]